MLTWTLIFCELNGRYSVLSGFTDSLLKTSLMHDSIIENAAEANSGEKDW